MEGYVIIGQFLVLKKIEDLFREWLKDTCDASAKQAPYFYCWNYQVVPWFYIPRIMLILHGPFFLDILASISSLFLSQSFFFLHICCCVMTRPRFSSYPQSLSAEGSVEVISQGWKEKREGALCICVTPSPLHLSPKLRAPVPGNVKSSHLPSHPKAINPPELHLCSHDGIWRVDKIFIFL